MRTEATRALVSRWIELAGKGDVDGAMALFSPDAVWTNIGSTRFSGRFEGIQEIMQGLLGPLFGSLEGTIESDIEAVIADGSRAVVLSRGIARSRSGADYNNTYAQVFTVEDGRIVAVREYMDTALIDAVFG
ncbi:nuclear transport factor 2 family protein [Congregibacter sp.]|uniref:nuclear transport factor 2 family protein n=1 Tax=Congregibacter sp. TaxID=2744308 RepID=UPI003F6CCAC6